MTEITIAKITSAEDMAECFHIRTVVFVEEQDVSLSEEIDGLDPEAEHYLLTVDGVACATARVRILGLVAKIERVAVMKNRRGQALGRKLMEFVIADIKRDSAITTLKLGAQVQVIDFYRQLGFKSYGDEFVDAGIRHRWMERPL